MKSPTICSLVLSKFANTIKGNREANLVPKYLADKLILCNQDFNQILIDFEKAYLNVIYVKIFTFVESVIGTKTPNLSMWAATNIVSRYCK